MGLDLRLGALSNRAEMLRLGSAISERDGDDWRMLAFDAIAALAITEAIHAERAARPGDGMACLPATAKGTAIGVDEWDRPLHVHGDPALARPDDGLREAAQSLLDIMDRIHAPFRGTMDEFERLSNDELDAVGALRAALSAPRAALLAPWSLCATGYVPEDHAVGLCKCDPAPAPALDADERQLRGALAFQTPSPDQLDAPTLMYVLESMQGIEAAGGTVNPIPLIHSILSVRAELRGEEMVPYPSHIKHPLRALAAPAPALDVESGHDIRCVDCGQPIGPGMVPCPTPGAGLYEGPVTKVTTPDGQVYRAHISCCWCGDHHEEGE